MSNPINQVCVSIVLLASMILHCEVFAEEKFQVSCVQVQCPGIVRTHSFCSDEKIWLQLNIQGIQSKESEIGYEVFAVLKSETTEIAAYRQRASSNTTSQKCDIVYLLEFPPQAPGKYKVDIMVTSKYNDASARCQMALEIGNSEKLHLVSLSFIDILKQPDYPVFYEGNCISLACLLPEIAIDNSLSIDLCLDDTANLVTHRKVNSEMQNSPMLWSLTIDKPGKHNIIINVKDTKNNEIQYNLPFVIIAQKMLE